jgi:hypothetical protein
MTHDDSVLWHGCLSGMMKREQATLGSPGRTLGRWMAQRDMQEIFDHGMQTGVAIAAAPEPPAPGAHGAAVGGPGGGAGAA